MIGEPKDAEFMRACLERARLGPVVVREALRALPEDDARRKPGVGKLSIFEHLWHLREMEREVFHVRLRRVLAEDNPKLAPVNQEHFVEEHETEGASWASVLDDWERLRTENVTLVEGTGEAEWKRPVRHPELGDKATFADVVARWSRHDAEHIRQIEILARNAHERHLPPPATGPVTP